MPFGVYLNIWEIFEVDWKNKEKRKDKGYTLTAHRARLSAAVHWAGPAARPRGRQGDVEGVFLGIRFPAGKVEIAGRLHLNSAGPAPTR